MFKRLLIPVFVVISFLCGFKKICAQCPTSENATCLMSTGQYDNVVIGEVSGDAGQSDGSNDGIVEIVGPPGTVIGCMVVSNSEWAVLIPPGTMIPSDGVFLIACSSTVCSGYGCGVGINGNMNGLIANGEGDYNAGLLGEIDLDVCAPANSQFYWPAANGFTIDNSNANDGDQVMIFRPDGTPHDGIYWGLSNTTPGGEATVGGASGASDHVTIQIAGQSYTLGDNDGDGIINNNPMSVLMGRGDNDNATAIAILPTHASCPCNNPSSPGTFTMPSLSDTDFWFNMNPLSETYVGCNSSFGRIGTSGGSHGFPTHADGEVTSSTQENGQNIDNGGGAMGATTGDLWMPNSYSPSSCATQAALSLEWGYTDHPTPGQPNNDPTYVFYTSTTSVCGLSTPVTFTVEIYNYQHVSDAMNTGSGVDDLQLGSLIQLPDGTKVPWTTYSVSGETTTLTYTVSSWPAGGTYTYNLVWDDFSNCCGSTSGFGNECYESQEFTISVGTPLMATTTTIDCPPNTAGQINVATLAGISGGCTPTYQLFINGVPSGASNTSGSFFLPTTSGTQTYTVEVIDGCLPICNPPLVITIGDGCELPPPACPTIDWDASTTSAGAKCPGDIIDLCITTDAACGSVIEFYNGSSATFDPYVGEGTLLGTVTVPCLPPAMAPGGDGVDAACPYISGIMVNACDGTGVESDNEFVVFGTGDNAIMIDNLNIDLPNSCSGGDVTTADSDDFSSNFIATSPVNLAALQPASCPTLLQIIDDGATIPANSVVIFFTSNNLSQVYDFSDLCGLGTVYILINECTATSGSFSNTAGRSTVFNYDDGAGPCVSNSYSYTSPVNSDGYYVSFAGSDNPGVSIAGSGLGTPNSGNSGSTSGGCAGPMIAVSNPPVCFSYTLDETTCNISSDDFFKAIIAPQPTSPDICTGTSTSPTSALTFTVTCPDVVIPSSIIDLCEADLTNENEITLNLSGITAGGGNYYIIYAIDGVAQPALSVAGGSTMATITIAAPTNGEVSITLVSVFNDIDGDNIQDLGECTGTVNNAEVLINIRPSLNITIESSTQPTNCSPCDGTITFNLTTGSSSNTFDIDYTYEGSTFSLSGVSLPYVLTNACPGTYDIISATDDYGCGMNVVSNAQILNLPAGTPIVINTQPAAICNDGSVMIDLSTIDMTPTYNATTHTFYSVDPNSIPDAFLPSVELDIMQTGFTTNTTIYVQYTDVAGCTSIAQIMISVDPSLCSDCPVISNVTISPFTCVGSNISQISTTGLMSMSQAENGVADLGINFVYFTGVTPPSDPYSGGTILGSVPFGNLTNSNADATLMNVPNTLPAGQYTICAILTDITGFGVGCAPSICTTFEIIALPVVDATDVCIGAPNVTFSNSGNTNGTWSVSGGGTINPTTGEFTATTAGCYEASFSTTDGSCEDTDMFIVYPSEPVLTAPTNTCNEAFVLPTVTPVVGFTIQYSINGGPWSTAPVIPTTPGCHTIAARYVNTAACGLTAAMTPSTIAGCDASAEVSVLIYPSEPVLTAPTNTCNEAFVLPTVTPVVGFTIQYSINGGPWSTAPVIPTTPGCHTIAARYVNTAACGLTAAMTPSTIAGCDASAEVSVLIYPSEPVLTAPSNTCNAAFVLPTVTPVVGFTVQYSINGGVWATAPAIPTTPGCHTIAARYVNTAACGLTAAMTPSTIAGCDASAEVSVLIYPSEPVLTAPTNTCNAAFVLPSVTPVVGFTVQYSINGGAWSTAPVIPTTPGCHTIAARYVNTAACGLTAALTPSTITGCDASAEVSVLIYPSEPVLTAPANTCNAAFVLPTVTPVVGFTVQYSINGGAWATAPAIPITPGCHTIAVRYVNTAACGSTAALTPSAIAGCDASADVNVLIYPSEPVLTAPTNTCNEAFVLPTVTPVVGFTVQYSINGGTWTTAPAIPTTPGCHTIAARYVNTAACGLIAALTPSAIAGCDVSNDVSVVIFPSAPVIAAPANTCNTAFVLPTVTPVVGFTVEYSINGGTWATAPAIPTTPGCHTIAARYVNTAACGLTAALTPSAIAGCDVSSDVSVVIFPSAPVIAAPANTCNTAFVLPTVTPVAGFTVEYSINGGLWATTPAIPTTPDCHSIAARYVLTADCGTNLAGANGDGLMSTPIVPSGAPTINEVLFNATVETGNTYGEGWEIAGTPGSNIGCYYFTDGDFVVQIPSGTTIPADGFYLIGSTSSNSSWSGNIDLLLTSTGVIPNLTNGGEYLAMFNGNNGFVDGVNWGSPSASNTPATTSAPTVAAVGSGCPVLPSFAMIQSNVIANAGSINIAAVGSLGDELSIELSGDVTGSWQASAAPGATTNTMGNTNSPMPPAATPCGASNEVNALIYPSEPVLTAPANTCNAAFVLPVVTPVVGFTIQYSINGGAWSTAPVIPTTPGCHTIAARYVNTAACGSTAALTPSSIVGCDASAEVSVLIYPSEPVLTAPTNTCNAAFVLPTVTPVLGFTVQYSINDGAWSTAPVIPTTPGCHTIAARYVNTAACGSTAALTPSAIAGCDASVEVSVLIYPSEPVLTAPTNTCNAAFVLPTVTPVVGFTIQYSINGGAWSTAPVIPTTPGCHTIAARYVNTAACGSTAALTPSTIAGCDATALISVVIFPNAPTITMPQASCMSDFRLPVVTSVTGFSVQYSVNGGAWTANPMTSMTPGCYSIQARYVLETACGSTPAGTPGTGSCGASNVVNTNVYPVPVIEPVTDVFMCDMSQVNVNFSSLTEILSCYGSASIQYQWTNNNTSIGLAASGTGNISFVATQPGTAFIIVTPIFTGPDGSCKGQPISFIISIHQETSIVCNDRVHVSLDENCEFNMSGDFILEGSYNEYFYNVVIKTSAGEIIDNSNVSLHIGEVLIAEVTDICNGNRCWGEVIFEDKLAPVVECNCTGPIADVSAFREIGKFGNKKYYLSNATYTWQQAYAHAQSVGGEMLCITSAAENAFILNTWTIPGFTSQRTWLGATDNETYGGTEANNTNNGWVWVSGEPFSYTNWASGEPNGLANEDYVEMFGTGGTEAGRWNDNTNTFGPLRYIMEIEDCTFKCYDLPVVQNETVPMLYGVSPNKSVLTTPPTATDGCGAVSATFTDAINGSDQCDTKELVRSWTFEDASGNKSYCTQRFAFEPISVTDLIPPVREIHLTCGLDASPAAIAGYLDVDSRTQPASATNIGAYADDYAQTGSVVEFNEGYSYGYFTYQLPGYAAPAGQPNLHSQKVDNNVCNLYTSYTDDVIPACGIGCSGNMKVIRNWKLLDWCTGEVFTYIQVIKATDEKAPTFNVKDATVGVDPWGCAANWNVGQPWELADNCAKAEEIKWGVKVPAGVSVSGTAPNYRITGLTKGTHKITYWASDCCGNVSEKDAYVTVIDASAPVAVAKQNIVMSLTGSGTGADGAGKIYGWQIDNGSYDHCSDVRFEVRRVDGGSCGNVGANGTHNNNSTYNDNNGYPSEVPGAVWFHPQDNAQDTDGGEFVKFCCEDIPAGSEFGLHDVELRVWDDGNMNGVAGDNDIINGMKDNYNTTWVTIRVENKLPPALVCPPDATITCDMELNLSLDAETNVNDVNLTMTGYPQAYDLCSNLQVTYKDQWVGQHDPVCKSGTVRRTFKVTKGSVVVTCTQFITVSTLTAPFTVTFPNQNQTTEWDKCNFTLDDARDAANASIKRPIVNYGQCDIVGENITIDTFLFEDGACKKWRVKYSYKNWCTGEEINTIAGQPIVHWYAFKDVTAPVLSCTNQMFAANPNPQNPNGGCEAQVALEASASDKLICAEESWIKWQMFFDGWNDGTVDRLGSSFVNKSWAGIWVPQAKFISGVLNPTWVALQNQHPNLPLADLVYVTYIKPTAASGGTAKLPVGTGATAFILNAENISHKVLWKVTDGCGNVDQCESTVMVVDKKAPTPYCVSVSTALMQTNPQMVELWARDFDKGAFDNCTPQSKLYFTFDGAAPIYSRVNDEHYYKVVGGVSVNATAAEYAQGKAYRWLPASRSAGFVWTAAGDYNVQVSVWDEAWNTDYCTVVLSVRGGNGSRVSGTVATASGQGVNDVTVEFATNAPEYPKSSQTLVNGTFGEMHPNGFDYKVTATKGGDFLNGVSTLDLVMIQRHILGLQALDSNYKMIAADANKDGKVTASDLTDLRKLILGVTTTLPNNTSWRFAVAGTPVQTSPIAFTEAINITNLSSDMDNQNFVAVKIGDVNGNVSTSVNSPEVESRSNANVEMSVAEASIAAGEVVEIPVTAANFSEVSGFQYTMNLNGASFVGVQSGVLEVNANNVGVISDNVVTMSYASSEAVNANEGAVLFTLTVKADKAMKVSEMISLNSEVTRAESYNSDLKVGKVSLGVRTAPVAGIELFQNEPNPFKGMTTVSFEMPEAATATLSVYDVTGKVVTVRNINAVKGLNSEIFTKDQLGVSGVLYYTLVSGDFTATKKMIIVE